MGNLLILKDCSNVTLISPNMSVNKVLTNSNVVLKSPSGKFSKISGKCEGSFQYKNKNTVQAIYVMDGQE